MEALSPSGALRPPSRPAGGLAIAGASVVDLERRRHRPATVLVDGGEVTAVCDAGTPPAPEREVIEATGLYLLPGLWDVHTHYMSKADAALSMPLLLANGVTGVRDMCSDVVPGSEDEAPSLADFKRWRAGIEAGEVAGPRLIALSSFVIDGPDAVPPAAPEFARAGTAEQARELVGYLRSRGVDFAKVYNRIPRAAYMAFAEEARAHDLPFAGHKPYAVTSAEAARAGQVSIEHALGILWDCLRPDSGVGPQRPTTSRSRQALVEHHDLRVADRLCDALAHHGTWYVPTHVTRWFDVRAAREDLEADQRLRYVPGSRRAEWAEDAAYVREANPGEEDVKGLERFYELGLDLTVRAHAAGVRVLAGSDANDSYIFPGFALHEELQHLERAGLSASAALRAATSEAALAFGLGDRYGRVAPGYAADLVLVRADPLSRIENAAAIEVVVHDGRPYPRAQLDAMLEHVAAQAATLEEREAGVW